MAGGNDRAGAFRHIRVILIDRSAGIDLEGLRRHLHMGVVHLRPVDRAGHLSAGIIGDDLDRIVCIIFELIVRSTPGYRSVHADADVGRHIRMVVVFHDLKVRQKRRLVEGGGYLTDTAAHFLYGFPVGVGRSRLIASVRRSLAQRVIIRKCLARQKDDAVQRLRRQIHIGDPGAGAAHACGAASELIFKQMFFQLFRRDLRLLHRQRNADVRSLLGSVKGGLRAVHIKTDARHRLYDLIIILRIQGGVGFLRVDLVIDGLHIRRRHLPGEHRTLDHCRKVILRHRFPDIRRQTLFIHGDAGLAFMDQQGVARHLIGRLHRRVDRRQPGGVDGCGQFFLVAHSRILCDTLSKELRLQQVRSSGKKAAMSVCHRFLRRCLRIQGERRIHFHLILLSVGAHRQDGVRISFLKIFPDPFRGLLCRQPADLGAIDLHPVHDRIFIHHRTGQQIAGAEYRQHAEPEQTPFSSQSLFSFSSFLSSAHNSSYLL